MLGAGTVSKDQIIEVHANHVEDLGFYRFGYWETLKHCIYILPFFY